MNIIRNQSLKSYNTFGIDVKADFFYELNSVQELNEISSSEVFQNEDLLIISGGSNLLLTKNFKGFVLKNNILGIELVKEDENDVFLKVGAGEDWHELVMYAVGNNWGGIENLSLIPGNAGTAPMQNIGAYGVELKDTFVCLEAFEIASGKVHSFTNNDCCFGYRESIFKNTHKGKYIITSITIKLSKKPLINIKYGDIKNELHKSNIANPSIRDVSNAVIKIRKSKLPDPNEIGNSGSFFKNPVITKAKLEQLLKTHPDIVKYPLDENKFKIAAGWLIEKAGWKGKTFDNYGVHKKQALVLVNYGGAKGNDINKLSELIIEDINAKFGIRLEKEVNVI
ncbi:MAG: UDP-N-acetylmuramate dehydrogenase [Flavobacteriales bacterium]|nr:UDP-N-acetylmuramate dehydrogenase [Flavobacteriales bacterium]